jgi:hypothetical protein
MKGRRMVLSISSHSSQRRGSAAFEDLDVSCVELWDGEGCGENVLLMVSEYAREDSRRLIREASYVRLRRIE